MRILLTGGTGDIGASVINSLLKTEAEIHSTFVSPSTLKSNSSRLQYHKVDLASVQEVVEFCESETVKNSDALIYCAGMAEVAKVGEIEFGVLNRMFQVNVISAIYLINAVLPKMIERQFGRIILIGSIVGDSGGIGLAGYSSTKSSLKALTKSIHREIVSSKIKNPNLNITVNLIKPGYCATKMTTSMSEKVKGLISEKSSLGRLLFPSEVAQEILRMVGDDSSHISGAEIEVFGGQIP